MGTLRKLMTFLGFSKKKDQTKKIAEQAKASHNQVIAEEDENSHASSRKYGRYGGLNTPGAFGKKPTIAVCRKMYRNRHGIH